MRRFELRSLCLLASLIVIVFSAITIAAQGSNPAPQTASLTGKYQGTAKGSNGDVKLTLDLADESGKISGQITSPNGVYKIVKAELKADVLTLEAEGTSAKGKMNLRRAGDKLTGDFASDGFTGPVEFKKISKDEITGEWDAVADNQGQAFPFTLTLKLDGEKVTGSSSSQLGTSQISSGNWKDGKLSIVLEGGAGQIALIATMIEGKLSGDYDYSGQLSGKWVAIRKQ